LEENEKLEKRVVNFMPVAQLNPPSQTGNQKSAEAVVSVRGLAGAPKLG
jgi:hypothetical protein